MIAFFGPVGRSYYEWRRCQASYTIDTIGAFFPAVMGALIVFPVYFIGKELINEKAGLIGAFMIAILPGQFLSRSVLGVHR